MTTPSWYDAFEKVKNQIAWLEHVPEEELTVAEAQRLCKASEHFLKVIKKLNEKYID